MPALAVVLANPGIVMPTGAVFAGLGNEQRSPLPALPPRFKSTLDLVHWLRQTRNDLIDPARVVSLKAGAAAKVLAGDPDCAFARMTGSGATAFGLFMTEAAAERAAERMQGGEAGLVGRGGNHRRLLKGAGHMAEGDDKPFIPVSFAVVLPDPVGQPYARRRPVGHDALGAHRGGRAHARRPRHRHRRRPQDPRKGAQMDRRPRHRCRHHHRRHRLHRPRCHAGGGRAVVREAHGGLSAVFHRLSYDKIGTATIQSRATAGLANGTFVFCLPGSPGACRDAWDGILVKQFDYRQPPCNFVEITPRLDDP